MPLQTTINLQNSASNPINSVFVAASAGSGKTTILTNRVLRLLLSGVKPDKILCLTFTKVATTEMQKRIFAELENWVLMDDEKLKNRLFNLAQQIPDASQIKDAQKLFITLLDNNYGLQISTIHSFCQSIIKKFPIEAKTSPNFTIIDDQTVNQLLLEARKDLLEAALQNQYLAAKINLISAQLNENSFLEITAELINKRQNLAKLKEQFFDIEGIIAEIYRQLNVAPTEDEKTVFADFIGDKNWQKKELKTICQTTKIKSKGEIEQFIDNPNLENLDEYLGVFLTNENEPRKKLATKEIQNQAPEADATMFVEQERIIKFLEKFNTIKIAASTSALLFVVDQIIEIYHRLKSQNGYLDYSDLIIKAGQLLENSANREWIKYKLDGVYEHILVDESQDTNHYQWNIIKAMAEEFFAGFGASDMERTIFIVGDEKQSIYSFQGAEPNIFADVFYYYQEKFWQINQKFLNVELNNSFRSLPAILQVVDAVFAKEQFASAISKLAKKISHNSIKTHHIGKVELMPAVFVAKLGDKNDDNKYQWNLDFAINEEQKSQEILAQIIAKKIANFFIDKKFLAIKNRPLEYGDIMILLKEKKSNFNNLLIKYLTQEQIPVATNNRLNFDENIVIQDLLSLAKFTLLPSDDLNLACLLKSPIINISEAELLAICLEKNTKKTTLFEALSHIIPDKYQQLLEILEQNHQQQFSVLQFFSYVLIKKAGKKAIIKRFGKDGEEIIDQFLKICLDYQSNNISASLQHFVEFVSSSDLTIKIDSNHQNTNQVFITTIHSAKGLEAPIVFLADAMHTSKKQIGNDKRRIFWDKEVDLPFWSIGKNFDNKTIKKIKQQERETTQKEYWRQLYVAMTRAEEELYICGFGEDKANECWYNAIKEAIKPIARVEKFKADGLIDLQHKDCLVGDSLIIGQDFISPNQQSQYLQTWQKEEESKIKADFINQMPAPEIDEEFLYPSQINQQNASVFSQSKANFGTIIHKILEFLPNLKITDQTQRTEFLQQYLTNNDLNSQEATIILNKINEIFAKFSDLLNNPNSKAEVPIIAKIDGKLFSGKIDRLIVEKDKVLIVDYKTGEQNDNLKQQYQEQMLIYQQIIQKLYPNKEVGHKIIWI